MKFHSNQPLLRLLMHSLVYPSVLGSILYSVLSNLDALRLDHGHVACIVMMASIVIFYSIDFLTTYLKERYSVVGFVSDVLIIALMYGAFASINFLQRADIHVNVFCWCMTATFAIFMLVDSIHSSAYGRHFRRILVFEFILVVCFAIPAACRLPGRNGLVAILSLTTASAMVWFFSRMYREHYQLPSRRPGLPRSPAPERPAEDAAAFCTAA